MQYFVTALSILLSFNVTFAACFISKDQQTFPLENKWDTPIYIPAPKPDHIVILHCFLDGKPTNVIPPHKTVTCHQRCAKQD